MKKNILGAAVVSLVTLAFLMVLNDIISTGNHEPQQQTVKVYETDQQHDIATLDEER
jgi:peptidoglycan hydrolase CwlO-like protein